MNLFINNVVLHLLRRKATLETTHFDEIFLQFPEENAFAMMKGKVLVRNADKDLEKAMLLLRQHTFTEPLTLVLQVDEYKKAKNSVKSMFKIVKAAGGIVEKGEQILMIYRLGKWDLPKGKLEKGESMEIAAVREVEEECGVQVMRHQKIATTWHNYTMNGKAILKKTKWYRMTLLDERNMQPQTEEDIERVQWMTENEVSESMTNSYLSIAFVIGKYSAGKQNNG